MAVERISEYISIQSEADWRVENSLAHQQGRNTAWLSDGKIEFQNVSLRYQPDQDPVLQDLNFVISPREKVAVVGRTGAGKSINFYGKFHFFTNNV